MPGRDSTSPPDRRKNPARVKKTDRRKTPAPAVRPPEPARAPQGPGKPKR